MYAYQYTTSIRICVKVCTCALCVFLSLHLCVSVSTRLICVFRVCRGVLSVRVCVLMGVRGVRYQCVCPCVSLQ